MGKQTFKGQINSSDIHNKYLKFMLLMILAGTVIYHNFMTYV